MRVRISRIGNRFNWLRRKTRRRNGRRDEPVAVRVSFGEIKSLNNVTGSVGGLGNAGPGGRRRRWLRGDAFEPNVARLQVHVYSFNNIVAKI